MTGASAIAASGPQLISNAGDLPFYPEHLLSERLEAHSFVLFHYRRWLRSETRIKADDDVRAYILDLFFIAQDETPVGTLPVDDVILASLLSVPLEKWHSLCARAISPMHKWTHCICGDEIRLMHPVVLEGVEAAVSTKRDNADKARKRADAKALKDLKQRMIDIGATRMAESQTMLERVHEWLKANCTGNRTESAIRSAMEAVSQP